jgi:hypothetical protein
MNKEGNLEEKYDPESFGTGGSINSDLLSEIHFRKFVIPDLTSDDTVVFLFQPAETPENFGT